MSLAKFCRLCLQNSNEFLYLTDPTEEIRELFVKLEQLFEINNFNNVDLPNKICHECEVKTNEFYDFWLKVKENQSRLDLLDLNAEFHTDEGEEAAIVELPMFEVEVLHEDEDMKDMLHLDIKQEDLVDADDEYHIEVLEPQFDFDPVIVSEPSTETVLNKQPNRNMVVVKGRGKDTPKPVQCDFCCMHFKTKKNLETHMAAFHQSEDYVSDEQTTKIDTTPRRPNKVKSKEEIEEEDRIIREFFELTCRECDDSPQFAVFCAYRNHMKDIHCEDKPFIECCNKKFYEKRKLVGHALLHINPDALKCKICNRQCISKPRLNEHMFDYHNPDGLRFKCDQCDRAYATKSALKHHLTTHLTDEEKQQRKKENQCPECGQGFITRTMLIFHIRNSHMKVDSCVCDHCAKVFSSKQSLKIHYDLKHSKTPPEKKQCPICSKWMPGERFLVKHINRIHKKKEGVNCSCHICGKTLSSENHLKKHIEHVHSAEPKYPCPHCEKAFRWPMGLKEHLSTHSGGKPLYQCPYCDKGSNSNANMLKHKRQVHPEKYEEERRKASVNNPGYERLNADNK